MTMKYLKSAVCMTALAAALVFSGCTKEEKYTESESSAVIKIEELKSKVTLGEYKGVSVTVEKLPDVTDMEVEDMLQTAVSDATVTKEIKDRAIAKGDTVNIRYTAYLDGEEIKDSTSEDFNLLIGSGVFFESVEQALIGFMPGEICEASAVIPEGYPQEELVGKTVVYKVTINYIAEEEAAELTDEFVAGISDCKTVEEYRESIRDMLEEGRENERVQKRLDAVWNAVMDNAEFSEYDEDEINNRIERYKSSDESQAEAFGLPLEEFVETYWNMSIIEYNKAIEEMAKREIKQQLVIDAIANAEGITGEDAEEAEIERCAYNQGYEVLDEYKEVRGSDGVKEDVKAARVFDFVVESAKITEE